MNPTIEQKTKLPDKPSELIRLALADLRKVERSKLYSVDMEQWHLMGPKCAVCLAGAVMAQTLEAPIDKSFGPHTFCGSDQDTRKKLYALDEFRCGAVEEGLGSLLVDLPDGLDDEREIADYAVSKAQFHRDMRKLADDLEGAGL